MSHSDSASPSLVGASLVELTQVTPQIAQLTLNDPQSRNAMSEAMAAEFRARVQQLGQQKGLRAIILTGAGGAFSAGGDLEMLRAKTEIDPATNRKLMQDFYDSFLTMLKLDVPIIAAIHGPAVGAGLCVACACDIRIATPEAKFGFTFVKLGLHPGMGATFSVPNVIGAASANELMLTGRIIPASEALQIGLCSRLVEPSELLSTAKKIAEEIAANGELSVRQLVRSMRADAPATLADALALESAQQAINYASDEYKQRIGAAIKAVKKKG